MERRMHPDRKPESSVFARELRCICWRRWGSCGSFLSGPACRLLSARLCGHASGNAAVAGDQRAVLSCPVRGCCRCALARSHGRARCAAAESRVSFGATVRIARRRACCASTVVVQRCDAALGGAVAAAGVECVRQPAYVRPAQSGELMLSVLATPLCSRRCARNCCSAARCSAWEPRGGRSAGAGSRRCCLRCCHGSLLGLPAQLLAGVLLALLVPLRLIRCTRGMIFHSAYNAAGGAVCNYVVLRASGELRQRARRIFLRRSAGGSVAAYAAAARGVHGLICCSDIRVQMRR